MNLSMIFQEIMEKNIITKVQEHNEKMKQNMVKWFSPNAFVYLSGKVTFCKQLICDNIE